MSQNPRGRTRSYLPATRTFSLEGTADIAGSGGRTASGWAGRRGDGLHPLQERVGLLLVFEAAIEAADPLPQRLVEHLPGPQRHLVAHQQPDLVEPLPPAVQRQQGPDLEEPGGDVEGPGQIGPLTQILQPRPPRHAVVDDEQNPAAPAARRLGHPRTLTIDRRRDGRGCISDRATVAVTPTRSHQTGLPTCWLWLERCRWVDTLTEPGSETEPGEEAMRQLGCSVSHALSLNEILAFDNVS